VYNNTGFNSANSSGNGIVFNDVDGGTIQRSTIYQNGLNCYTTGGGPFGAWSFDCKNVTIQYCEAYGNGSLGLYDGGGFDIDGGDTNCIIQYSYSHDNMGAGFLCAEFYGAARAWNNNTIRYNISHNDATQGSARGQGAVTLWSGSSNPASQMKNALIYGNTVYVAQYNALLDDSPTTNTRIYNNIFYADNGQLTAEVGDSAAGGVTLCGNDYFSNTGTLNLQWNGVAYNSLADFQNATQQETLNGQPTGSSADPLLVNVLAQITVNNPDALATSLTAFQLTDRSPLLALGINLQTQFGIHTCQHDFFGNSLPSSGAYSVGSYQGQGLPPPGPTRPSQAVAGDPTWRDIFAALQKGWKNQIQDWAAIPSGPSQGLPQRPV
jgi:hypothetical protein